MQIILVPNRPGSGKNSCLSHRHLLVILLIGGLVLPLFFGILAFRIHALLERHAGEETLVSAYGEELTRQSQALEAAKGEAATHLNALALKLGQLQAQVLRLNALGGRLTSMAGLDRREFNFETEVAQGGPEHSVPTAGLDVLASLDRLSLEINASRARLQALETLLLDRRLTDAVTPAGWPADGGFVSSPFGSRADPFTGRLAYHEGVDIAAKQGSPIRAMADGVVSYAGEKSNYGRLVEVTHASGLVTRYAHVLSLLVKVGDKVTRGDAIALVGSSGRSTGPHVHVEVLKDGRAVNPAGYLRAAR